MRGASRFLHEDALAFPDMFCKCFAVAMNIASAHGGDTRFLSEKKSHFDQYALLGTFRFGHKNQRKLNMGLGPLNSSRLSKS